MHVGEHNSADLMAVSERPSDPQAGDAPAESRGQPTLRRWQAAAILTAAAIALFAVLLRISDSFPLDSDAANNALQAWDMLHGNLLLHTWIIGDATYYTFELPLFMITEAIFGLGSIVPHVVCAVVYVIVIATTMALARVGSRGMAAAIRAGIVLAILSIPLLLPDGVSLLIEKPDHTGTAAITIACFLLIEKIPTKRYTAPVLCAILVAGQFSDATVLYVTVPAVIAVSAYRIAMSHKIRSADGAMLLATVLSVPLDKLLYSAVLHAGGFVMISPLTQVAPYSLWNQNYHLTVHGLQLLFGALPGPDGELGVAGAVLGYIAIAAALYGFGRVIFTWTRATRAEQMLCVAVVLNIAAYMFSTLPVASNPRELVYVLPAGAVLAARGLARGRGLAGRRAWAALATAAAFAFVPLAVAASQPATPPSAVQLASWLKAHHLKYGIAGYWNASSVTLVSGGQVKVRAVARRMFGLSAKDWETNWTWYYRHAHYASFAIANTPAHPGTIEARTTITVAQFEKVLGKPVASYYVAGQIVMIYDKNLLNDVAGALPLPPPPGTRVYLHHNHQSTTQPQG